MNMDRSKRWCSLLLITSGLLVSSAMSVGCQTNIGGQTLPSAFYLKDDIQYYPPSTETPLPNARRAQREYRLNQQNQ